MTDFAELRTRIEEAKKRLGIVEDGQAQQFEALKSRLATVKEGLVRTQAEVDQHRQEAERVTRENDQLRGMLHKLLIAIEVGYGERLKDILQDIEGEISTLVDLTEDGETDGTDDRDDGDAPNVSATQAAAGAGQPDYDPGARPGLTPRASAPDATDSRWLQEIMETAKHLTTNMKQAAS